MLVILIRCILLMKNNKYVLYYFGRKFKHFFNTINTWIGNIRGKNSGLIKSDCVRESIPILGNFFNAIKKFLSKFSHPFCSQNLAPLLLKKSWSTYDIHVSFSIYRKAPFLTYIVPVWTFRSSSNIAFYIYNTII